MNAMVRLAAQENARASREWDDGNRSQGGHKVKTGAYLVAEFAAAKGVEVLELLRKDGNGRLGRIGELHDLRYECWAMLRDKTALSYPQIGRMFSGRDHSTIITGVKKHRAKEAI